MHAFQFTVLCSLVHHCLLGSKKLGCKEMWFGSGERPESNHGESPLTACKRGEAGGGRWSRGGECRAGGVLPWSERKVCLPGGGAQFTHQRAKYPPHSALKPNQAKLGEEEQNLQCKFPFVTHIPDFHDVARPIKPQNPLKQFRFHQILYWLFWKPRQFEFRNIYFYFNF